ncbi:hypothetical protein PFISCL1PPCAC_28702, partial [Pristionchus fissidentatus]
STRARSDNTDGTPLIAGCVRTKKRCSCRRPSSSEASSSADPPLKDAHFCALRIFPNEIYLDRSCTRFYASFSHSLRDRCPPG